MVSVCKCIRTLDRCIGLLFAISCGHFYKYKTHLWRSLQILNKTWTYTGFWVSVYHSSLFSTILCGSRYIYVIVTGHSIYIVMMRGAGATLMCLTVSDLFPVPGFHMQLHQSLQVSHLGISLWGIAMVLQLLEVERTFCQQLTFSLVQLTSNVNQPG